MFCLIVTLSGVGLVAQGTSKLVDESDADFWKSVYEENHVVEIDISLTKDAWESMTPKSQERGRGSDAGFT